MNQKSLVSNELSLYDDDALTMPTLAAYLRSFTIPGPLDKSCGAGGVKVTISQLTIQQENSD